MKLGRAANTGVKGGGKRISSWLPIPLRVIVVLLLAPSALFKFVDYPTSVEGFAGIGIPAAEIIVLVVAAFEAIAVVALSLGVAGRIACVPVLVIMVVAMTTAGVAPSNVAVLVGTLGLILLGTGAYSLWKPEDRLLRSILYI